MALRSCKSVPDSSLDGSCVPSTISMYGTEALSGPQRTIVS
jgi:hypothetical protein